MNSIVDSGLTYGVFLALIAVEYLYRVPLANTLSALANVGERAFRTLRSKHISDHWKERVLLRYARDMLTHTGCLAALMAGCALLVILPALLLDAMLAPTPSVVEAMSSATGLILVTVCALVYAGFRSWLAK